jgi:hypothetical protein
MPSITTYRSFRTLGSHVLHSSFTKYGTDMRYRRRSPHLLSQWRDGKRPVRRALPGARPFPI